MKNAMNAMVQEQLKKTMAAVYHLDDAGCTVIEVSIGRRNPVVTIESGKEPFVRGAVKSRRTVDGITRVVVATTSHGCQIEWCENYAPVAQAVRS